MLLKIRIKNFSFQLLFLHECNVKIWGFYNCFVLFSAINEPFSANHLEFSDK